MVMLFVITMSEWGVWSYSQSLLQPVCFTKEFYSVFLCLNMIYTNLNQIVFIRRSPSSLISLGRRSTTIRVEVNMLTLSGFKTRFLSWCLHVQNHTRWFFNAANSVHRWPHDWSFPQHRCRSFTPQVVLADAAIFWRLLVQFTRICHSWGVRLEGNIPPGDTPCYHFCNL